MNLRHCLTGFALLLLLGCASPRMKADFESGLQGWVGRPVVDYAKANGGYYQAEELSNGGRRYRFLRTSPRGAETVVTSNRYMNIATGQVADVGPGGVPPAWAESKGVRVQSDRANLTPALYCRVLLDTDKAGLITATRYEGTNCW